jgi:3-methyladenine DNA glycosylase AlkD
MGQLEALASGERARASLRFFKTGPGDYGEGDKFLGVAVPVCRRMVRPYHASATRETIVHLLNSPWHEVRFSGLLLLIEKSERADDAGRAPWASLYLENSAAINNWDLVDVSAPQVLGSVFCDKPLVLRQLACSGNLWEQRMAILATWFDIRRGRFSLALSVSRQLLDHPHDLIHKAVGWMLREVGKRDEPTLCAFLDQHAASMPRTTLRYAIERFPTSRRRHYLGLKQHPGNPLL